VKAFVEACYNSGFKIEVFIDDVGATEETKEKFRSRRE
jgi:hypothetical protein